MKAFLQLFEGVFPLYLTRIIQSELNFCFVTRFKAVQDNYSLVTNKTEIFRK